MQFFTYVHSCDQYRTMLDLFCGGPRMYIPAGIVLFSSLPPLLSLSFFDILLMPLLQKVILS